MIKFIVVDLDDTLIGMDLRVSSRNKKAIRRALKKGIQVTIATGRTFQTAEPFVQKLGIRLPVICYNGALVRNTHKVHIEKMLPEYFEITKETADKINSCRQKDGRIIAVGTSTVRALESQADVNGNLIPGKGETELYIYPGYKFKVIDAMLTNFHLPKSTNLILVSAFAGKEKLLSLYKSAMENNYRFYSYGDAMLVL